MEKKTLKIESNEKFYNKIDKILDRITILGVIAIIIKLILTR
jgi:hypothetical protein